MSAAVPVVAAPVMAGRPALYVGGNVAFSLVVIAVSVAGGASEPRTLYLCLLMALCTLPLLWMRAFNDRFTLLGIFLATYFLYYGLYDLTALFDSRPRPDAPGLLSLAELGVLLGAAVLIAGYRVALGGATGIEVSRPALDWPMWLTISMGLAFWSIGTATDWYWQLNFTGPNAFEDRSASTMTVLVISRMLQPLGTVMLGYALVSTRSRSLLLVICALMVVQILVGFIGNSKETAMRGIIILCLSAFLLRGRVPKGWVVAGLAFVVLAFPIFQAYRAEVIGMRGLTRANAAEDIGRAIEMALSAREKVRANFSEDYRVPTFVERTALKPTLEMMIAETGNVAEFQSGYTLSLYFTGFVPRFIWPDKPDSSVGRIVNREFRVSEDPNTYISATHLGELYWNFGWAGIAAGMFALGLLLGFINRRCDLSESRSLTRLLVLVTVIYAVIVRMEGSIALEYIVLTRSLFIIWILHLLFARVPAATEARRGPPSLAPLIHAPQLMR